METLTRNIREARKATGLSQDLASRKCGIGYAHYVAIEKGIRSPSLRVLEKIAEALETTVSQLTRD